MLKKRNKLQEIVGQGIYSQTIRALAEEEEVPYPEYFVRTKKKLEEVEQYISAYKEKYGIDEENDISLQRDYLNNDEQEEPEIRGNQEEPVIQVNKELAARYDNEDDPYGTALDDIRTYKLTLREGVNGRNTIALANSLGVSPEKIIEGIEKNVQELNAYIQDYEKKHNIKGL